MNRFYTVTGGIFGFIGVGLGAFGAHGLKGTLSPEMMEIFRTGVLYQLIHTVVITAIAINGKKFDTACLFFAAGVILFSFSLYLYAITGIKTIAMVTPLGGLSFLIGWSLVIIIAIREKRGKGVME